MKGQIKCFPDKVKLKEFIFTKPLLYEMLKGLNKEKDDKKTMNSNIWQTQLSTTNPKNKNKDGLSKQLEQEQNHINADYM